MTPQMIAALTTGTERLAAWSDLLDSINVFPVADGDTGRNLVLSLAPLRGLPSDSVIEDLLLSARGNSGNIAASFFTGFLSSFPKHDLAHAVSVGRKMAFGAVPDPKKGTMLDVFETLEKTAVANDGIAFGKDILERLRETVMATTEINPMLKDAMVVDSGALGMFIFFDAFFNSLNGTSEEMKPITEIFNDRLTLNPDWKRQEGISGSCIDFVMKIDGDSKPFSDEIGLFDESVVSIRHGEYLKVHLHADSSESVRSSVAKLGKVIRWSEDDLSRQTRNFGESIKPVLHIVSDAAGSVTRSDAASLGVTLLDSYISLQRQSVPETCLDPEQLYSAMRNGIRATTSQASVFERHQHYDKILGLYNRALYLCVGSAFTGNYHVVKDWKASHDPDNRLAVIDTGAASGRLGLIVISAARYSLEASKPEDVIAFSEKAVSECEEYVFIDKLQYLVAGGRVSKASGFFADLLNMKPVVSPHPEGVKKLGVVRNRKDQISFAVRKIRELLKGRDAIIMLEYSDNSKWLEDEIMPLMRKEFKGSEIILQQISLTSGTHMGPGTWAVAVMPEIDGLRIRRHGEK